MTDTTVSGMLHRRITLWGVPGVVVLMIAVLAGVVIGETPLPLSTVAAAFANNLWDAGHMVDPIDA